MTLNLLQYLFYGKIFYEIGVINESTCKIYQKFC